jgi:hypothetical protein
LAAAQYVPGVCNIGPDEIRARRRGGLVALGTTFAGFVVLHAIGASPAVHLFLFLPALGAAIGLLQAVRRFCIHFGWSSLFNFGAVGKVHRGGQTAGERDADRGAAIRLIVMSAAAAAAFAALAALSAVLVQGGWT